MHWQENSKIDENIILALNDFKIFHSKCVNTFFVGLKMVILLITCSRSPFSLTEKQDMKNLHEKQFIVCIIYCNNSNLWLWMYKNVIIIHKYLQQKLIQISNKTLKHFS